MHKTVTKMADRETKPSMTSLRMTDKLRLKLIQSASASGRSLNAEITSLLEQAVFEQSLEAMLRCVVREEIAAALSPKWEMNEASTDALAAFGRRVGEQIHREIADADRQLSDDFYNSATRQFTDYVPDEDAIAIMARAQQ